jgi:hypothetical protein
VLAAGLLALLPRAWAAHTRVCRAELGRVGEAGPSCFSFLVFVLIF